MKKQEKIPADKPPFFSKWRHMYLLVLGVLASLIVLFYLLSARYI